MVSDRFRVRIKVCCISSVAEMRLAVEAGADAVGLVGRMPSGPGVIDDGLIREIAGVVPAGVSQFLLTSETEPAAVVDHVRRAGVDTVQIVDDEVGRGVYAAVRAELPAVRIVQVIHVLGEASYDKAMGVAGEVDGLLLDSGNPGAAVRELGGTGRVHDWGVSARIARESPVPVFLAGGLKPENVAEAVRVVRPFGVDVCSGVRCGGRLDRERLGAFVGAVGTR